MNTVAGFKPGSIRILLMLVVGLGVGGVLASLAALGATWKFFPLTAATLNMHVGQGIFAARCKACHAMEAGSRPKMGPNLSEVNAAAAASGTYSTTAEYVLESIVAPERYRGPGVEGAMPSGLVDDVPDWAVRALVAYVVKASEKVNAKELLSLKVVRPPIVRGEQRGFAHVANVRRGEDLFLRQLGCAACHGILGEIGEDFIAPSLHHAGLLPEVYLEASIAEPSSVISAGYARLSMTLKDGSQLVGREWQRREDGVMVLISNEAGRWSVRDVPFSKVRGGKEGVNELPISTMPVYSLGVQDKLDLMAFLKTLKAL